MGAYDSLLEKLRSTSGDTFTSTLNEVEQVLGRPLPDSARRYPAFWSKGNHVGQLVQSQGWRATLNPVKGVITFRRITTDKATTSDTEEATERPVVARSRSAADQGRFLPVGTQIHWYEIREVLGHGGFGITYLARDTHLNTQVAIKEFFPAAEAHRSANLIIRANNGDERLLSAGIQSFLSEARTVAKFDHPNIVKVLNAFPYEGTAYMVMRYEKGITLDEYCRAHRNISETWIGSILEPLLSALESIHLEGCVHRDIKPANILVRESGGPLLIDFGAARQFLGDKTHTLTAVMSSGYAPFEQYGSISKEQGPWTDIYALAAVLYRLVVGRTPISAFDRSKAILGGANAEFVFSAEIAGDKYSKQLLAAIDAGLRFSRHERPQSVNEWRKMFQAGESKVENFAPLPKKKSRDLEVTRKRAESIVGNPSSETGKKYYRLKVTPTMPALSTYFAGILIATGMDNGGAFPLKRFLSNFSSHTESGRIIRSGTGYKLTPAGHAYFEARYQPGNKYFVNRSAAQELARHIVNGDGGPAWEPLDA